ncbi:MAG: hypothetical protein HGA53_02030 [Anaerolineaceae bacterium]|nr:hypothetical protein [Anaerolineaceae bacterium]
MLSIETEDPFIRQICREAKYLPDKSHERAKYLFFDEQWEEYSLNDINHAFMKGYYQVASTEERRKISRHIQVSGQTDLFDILTSRITIQNQTTTSFEEQQYLASILTSTKAWNSLWEMAQNTFPSIAAEIIKSISTQGWIPEGPNDQLIFYSLVEMAKRSMLFDLNTLEMILPAALPQADLQIHGTVNCTSFSLTDPVLAIGTNEKKIALWNYQLGKMENIVSGFNHSLSNLAYSNTGDLFVSEKSIGAQNCGIYLWKNHELALIGLHNASITAIVPYGDHLLLSGGRDFTINQWDSGHNRKIATIQCPDWPRSLSFHETRQQAIGLDSKITLINWAEKKISRRYQISTNTSRGIRRSINQCALISPNDDRIFIGQHNGQVIAIDGLLARHRVVTSLITNFSGRVIGINQLPFKPYCIAGSASGELGLIDQTNMPTVRMIPSPTAGMTSLTVSPDGNYMATGYRKNRQTLWDLEVLKIPALLNQPIAFDHANTLNMINKFSGDLRLTEEVRNSLQFLKLLLQHRYRYDIDIVQTTGIVPGLFDIILDNQ